MAKGPLFNPKRILDEAEKFIDEQIEAERKNGSNNVFLTIILNVDSISFPDDQSLPVTFLDPLITIYKAAGWEKVLIDQPKDDKINSFRVILCAPIKPIEKPVMVVENPVETPAELVENPALPPEAP